MNAQPKSLRDHFVDALLSALVIVILIALYGAVDDGPSETDALQLSAEISNDIAAENAAQRALVASKD
ncbi:hypothetical protein ABIC89_000407 [Variovorax boronicumulans]|uniref:hypothetical protein n=1 Tax=Variovorax boronicumulans TaxID=436515 RepID=UPI0033976778